MEEAHVNLIGSDSGDGVFLTEEEQGFFSDDQNPNTYEKIDDYRSGFENEIMEVHKQYDLRSKGNADNLKDKSTNTAVKKNTETQPKKTAEKTNILTKKLDLNKEKNIQPNVDKVPLTLQLVVLIKLSQLPVQTRFSKSKLLKRIQLKG